MRFNWESAEKERYYRKAEKQLKEAGIDFVSVDRTQFGVRKWDKERKEAEAIYIGLTPYPYCHFSNARRGKLKRLGNWQCTDPKRKKQGPGIWNPEGAPTMMHSRLVYEEEDPCRTEEKNQKRNRSGSSAGRTS